MAYKDYTDEDIIRISAEVTSMAQLLAKLGLRPAGGNYNNMRRTLQRLGLECDHWKGQGWNRGQRQKDWSDYSKLSSIKRHLIKERGHRCEHCGLTEWRGDHIPLEVDHVDGDRTNNDEKNLELVCPNCHALTPTWRGRNRNAKSVSP